jgi:hypothetical protein
MLSSESCLDLDSRQQLGRGHLREYATRLTQVHADAFAQDENDGTVVNAK